MSKQQGLPPSKRPIKDNITSNQYISSPKQNKFVDNYIDPKSPTFGNAYQSAIQAGYSKDYAVQILSPAVNTAWIKDNPRLRSLTEEHINKGIEGIAVEGEKEEVRLRAYELLARLRGLLVERKQIASVVRVELGQVNAPIETSLKANDSLPNTQ